MSRTPRSVLKTPFAGKGGEFLASKLWTIVTYYDVWDPLSRKVTFQLLQPVAKVLETLYRILA